MVKELPYWQRHFSDAKPYQVTQNLASKQPHSNQGYDDTPTQCTGTGAGHGTGGHVVGGKNVCFEGTQSGLQPDLVHAC